MDRRFSLPALFADSSSGSGDGSSNKGDESRDRRFFFFAACDRESPTTYLGFYDECFKAEVVVLFLFYL